MGTIKKKQDLQPATTRWWKKTESSKNKESERRERSKKKLRRKLKITTEKDCALHDSAAYTIGFYLDLNLFRRSHSSNREMILDIWSRLVAALVRSMISRRCLVHIASPVSRMFRLNWNHRHLFRQFAVRVLHRIRKRGHDFWPVVALHFKIKLQFCA